MMSINSDLLSDSDTHWLSMDATLISYYTVHQINIAGWMCNNKKHGFT